MALGQGSIEYAGMAPGLYIAGMPIETITVTISSAARDAGLTGGDTPSTTLTPGLVLGRITASGLFVDHDDLAADGSQIVNRTAILLTYVDDISTGNQQVTAAIAGSFDWAQLRWGTAAAKAAYTPEDSNFQFGATN